MSAGLVAVRCVFDELLFVLCSQQQQAAQSGQQQSSNTNSIVLHLSGLYTYTNHSALYCYSHLYRTPEVNPSSVIYTNTDIL